MTISPEPSQSAWDQPLAEVRLEYAGATYSGFVVGHRLHKNGTQEAMVSFFYRAHEDATPRRVTLWIPYDQLSLVE